MRYLKMKANFFAVYFFFCKNVHPIVKSYNMLSWWRWAKFVANQTTIYDYMAVAFCKLARDWKISCFPSQASISHKKNCHFAIIWIQKCCLKYHFLNLTFFAKLLSPQLIQSCSLYFILFFTCVNLSCYMSVAQLCGGWLIKIAS